MTSPVYFNFNIHLYLSCFLLVICASTNMTTEPTSHFHRPSYCSCQFPCWDPEKYPSQPPETQINWSLLSSPFSLSPVECGPRIDLWSNNEAVVSTGEILVASEAPLVSSPSLLAGNLSATPREVLTCIPPEVHLPAQPTPKIPCRWACGRVFTGTSRRNVRDKEKKHSKSFCRWNPNRFNIPGSDAPILKPVHVKLFSTTHSAEVGSRELTSTTHPSLLQSWTRFSVLDPFQPIFHTDRLIRMLYVKTFFPTQLHFRGRIQVKCASSAIRYLLEGQVTKFIC